MGRGRLIRHAEAAKRIIFPRRAIAKLGLIRSESAFTEVRKRRLPIEIVSLPKYDDCSIEVHPGAAHLGTN
jgi:hypothetical protein